MNKCSSCKTFYEPIQKPNGTYYKCCNRCLLKSKKKIDNIDEPIKTEEPIKTDEPIKTNNDIIDEYLNIIKFKNSIIEKLTNDNIKLMNDINNLNNIINDYKETLSQQQQPQQPPPQQQQQPNINNDRLQEMINQMMKK
jgi:hypothetical protein